MDVLVVVSRWLHVMSAILAIGGAFFLRVVLPPALAQADAASRDAVLRRARRIFKIVIHVCATLLLLSGAFNSWRNFGDYTRLRESPALMHALWGTHMLLGLVAIGISIWLLAPKEPSKNNRKWLTVNLVILFLAVALASTLKNVRDAATKTKDWTTAGQVGR